MSIVSFDIETASAHELHTSAPGFCRLAGYAINDGPVQLTSDMEVLCAILQNANRVVAHNALAFDLAALERYHGLDVGTMVEEGRVRDTLILARHNDPPFSGNADARRYSLDAIGRRLLGDGKVSSGGESALKQLEREFGGFGEIPVDDERYRDCLRRDVELVRQVFARLRCDEYAIREHRVMWRLNHVSRFGFRVDVVEVERRLAAQRTRVEAAKQRLAAGYGLPTTGKAPHHTRQGLAALEEAFKDCGVEPPRTDTGVLATNKVDLAEMLNGHPCNVALADLVEALLALGGERSVTQTILNHTSPDGRVHPHVDARQATGRISLTKPGLTVTGTRDRSNALERSLLLPDEGDVLTAFDLSQIDARAIAAHCQDSAYIAVFEEGKDYHTEMAIELFGDPGRRSDAKPVTHATTYGMGVKGLAEFARIGRSEAQSLLSHLHARFPMLARFKGEVRVHAERKGVLWNAFGRPVRILPGSEYTQAPAAIGQGTARDLMMEGILRLPGWLLPCLRAIVHDEILLSVPENRADEAEKTVLHALQFSFQLRPGALAVPILAEKSDRGRDWADCYRSEKNDWPEVARAHRELPSCDDADCTWHTASMSTGTVDALAKA